MTDTLTPQKRSWNMSRIRSFDTKPEVLLRSLLHRMVFRFRVHRKDLPGRPDIVLPKYRTVVLVHGCFWHQHPGCVEAAFPKSNRKYWKAKLEGNVARDRRNQRALRKDGWRVLRCWECQLEKDPAQIAMHLARELRGPSLDNGDCSLPSRTQLLKAAETRANYKRRRSNRSTIV